MLVTDCVLRAFDPGVREKISDVVSSTNPRGKRSTKALAVLVQAAFMLVKSLPIGPVPKENLICNLESSAAAAAVYNLPDRQDILDRRKCRGGAFWSICQRTGNIVAGRLLYRFVVATNVVNAMVHVWRVPQHDWDVNAAAVLLYQFWRKF